MSSFSDGVSEYEKAKDAEWMKLGQVSEAADVLAALREFYLPDLPRMATALKSLALGADSEGVQLSALKHVFALCTKDVTVEDEESITKLLNELKKAPQPVTDE